MDGKKRRFPTFSVAFLSLLSDIARSLERFDRPRPCYSLDNRKQRNRNRESINSSVVGVWKRSSIEWWLRCLRGDMKEYEDWENEGKLNRWRIVCSCGECRQWTTSNNNVYTIHKYMDAYEKWINLRIHKWDRLIKKKSGVFDIIVTIVLSCLFDIICCFKFFSLHNCSLISLRDFFLSSSFFLTMEPALFKM